MKHVLKTNPVITVFLFILFTAMSLTATNRPQVMTQTSVVTITQEDIADIPTARTVLDVLQTVPGVNIANDNNVSIRGGSSYDNAFLFDGVNVSDPVLANRLMSLPLDAVQELQVMTGGANAEYGRFTGGVINVITKSGGNELSGSAQFRISPDFLGADLDEGIQADAPHYQNSYQGSFNLGGPIIRDKLWFFGAGDVFSGSSQPLWDGDEPENHLRINPFFKLDYQLDSNNRFGLMFNYEKYGFDLSQSEAGFTQEENYWTPRLYVGANWNHSFWNGWQSNLNFGFHNYKFDTGTSERTDTPDFVYQYEYNKIKTNTRFQTGLDVTAPPFSCKNCWHWLKGGLEFGTTSISKEVRNEWYQSTTTTYPGYTSTETREYLNLIDQRARMTTWSFYIQDEWRPNDRFSANFGWRYDGLTYSWPKHASGDYQTDAETAYTWHMISPRISLTYDITGDGKNVVDFSYGRYYQPLQYGWVDQANPMGNYGYDRAIFIQDQVIQFDDRIDFYNPPAADVGYEDVKLKAPVTDALSLGFQRQLWKDWSLGLRYIKKWDRNLIHWADASALDMDALLDDGVLQWIDYDPVTLDNPLNGDLIIYDNQNPGRTSQYYIVNPPEADRNYDGIELLLNKHYSKGWSMRASYTYSNTRGLISNIDWGEHYGQSHFFTNPNAHINASGVFDYAYQHQVKITGMYQLPWWGIEMYGFFHLGSGSPYTLSLSPYTDPLSMYDVGNGNIFAEPRGDSRLPTFWMLNLGLEKTFKVTDTTTATLFVDGYNITNNAVELKVNPLIGSTQGDIQRILNPGLFQFGVRVSF